MPNSVTVEKGAQQKFIVSRNIFSPDGDAYEDEWILRYSLNDPDFVVRMSIYDEGGRLMHHVYDGISLGSSGTLVWNGTDAVGDILPVGIYFIVLEGLSPRGLSFVHHETAVLASKY